MTLAEHIERYDEEDGDEFPSCYPPPTEEEEAMMDDAFSGMFEEEDAQAKRDLWFSVKFVLRDRLKSDDKGPPNRLSRWFHVVKFLLCVAGDRFRMFGGGPDYPDDYEVAVPHCESSSCGWDATTVHVGAGVFKSWWYHIEHDGDSFM